MKILIKLLFLSLVLLAVVNTGCKKDPETENAPDGLVANFQGVFSEEIGVVELDASIAGVQAKVNMNGEVIDFTSSQILEKGSSVTVENQDVQLTISADASEVLTVELVTSSNAYEVVGVKSDQAELFMGVVDESINGAMELGMFNFTIADGLAKGLIYFEGVDTEPLIFEGTVLSASETQVELEIERSGVAEQVVVELVESFGKTNSGGLNVSAVPVTISTSNVGPNASVGKMIIGFSDSFGPPYDTIEITQAKLTSLGSYGGDATGRFHKLSFATSLPLWGGAGFYDEGLFMDLIFSTSTAHVNNIEGVYSDWSTLNPSNTNKQLVSDYAADSLYFQESLDKATNFVYMSNKIADLNISRLGMIYTISCDVVYSYPMDLNGNVFGVPERFVKFNYTGVIDLY